MKAVTRQLVWVILFGWTVPAVCAFAAESKEGGGKKSSNILRGKVKDVVVRQVKGRGGTREKAIEKALKNAVSQVRGVEVGSGRYRYSFQGAGVGFDTETPGTKRIEFDSVGVATEGTAHTTATAGLVKSYEVLEEKEIDEETYEVKLKVQVYDYGKRSVGNRVKLALMPTKSTQGSYRFLGLATSAAELSVVFGQYLATGLVETNKFAVLDRENLVDFAREEGMLVSSDAPLSEQAKLAETVGADYLLAGTISQAMIEQIKKHLAAANYTTTEYKARFSFNYRLVDSATKQVAFASVVRLFLENEEVRELADEIDSDEWDAKQVRDAFLSLAAKEVVGEIIGRIYPIRIVVVQPNGKVILNQGGERMSEGMMLEVFVEGEELFDPDTGESLGRPEESVAMVQIDKVSAAMSSARVVGGDVSRISKGQICRIQKMEQKKEVGMEPDVRRGKNGGVKLPFDK